MNNNPIREGYLEQAHSGFISAFFIGAEVYSPILPRRFLYQVWRTAIRTGFGYRFLPGYKITGRVLVAAVKHPPFPGSFLDNITFAAFGATHTHRHGNRLGILAVG